jgi:hypothetical protein
MATTTRFGISVIDGECHPVAGLQLGARYKYENSPSSWNCETTDGDGLAFFCDEHSEPPLEVSIYVDDTLCDSFPVVNDSTFVLEV